MADPLPDDVDILNINVGVLGHVDSGKTSLVKALSTHLSTAALDKSKQSRQRGMTLDLGFSCFFLDMPPSWKEKFPGMEKLQMTLVDCPGHASLIRTIIGGAQIIDLVLLVVDAVKGWQAQTTECLVLAELTSPHVVVALNKCDMLDPSDRENQIETAKKKVRDRLSKTRFADAPIVGVAACVGGEKVAALETSQKNESFNIDRLISTLQEKLPPPIRSSSGPFYFAIDHCFALRGRGTVITGTVLSGKVTVNDVLDFPTVSLERKIKSMQMFKRQVETLKQGDRGAICVSNFDSKMLERGMAAEKGVVKLYKGAIAVVRKVPYYPGSLPCKSKFHVSVGHSTVMATVSFFGARELNERKQERDTPDKLDDGTSSLGRGADVAGLPKLPFDFNQTFLFQDQLLETLEPIDPTGSSTNAQEPLLHWAILDFQIPIHCPPHSLIIGSRLDTVDNASGSVSTCRLAFSGRLIESIDPDKDVKRLRIYTPKERRGVISRLGDPHKRQDDGKFVRYEVFGSDLFKKETNMKIFTGMKVETERKGGKDTEVGEIKSSFGTTGKFRVYFPGGTEAREGDALVLRFKRFTHDEDKTMYQDISLPPSRPGVLLDVQKKKGKKNAKKLPAGVTRNGEVTALKGDLLENGTHNMAIISGFFAPEVNIKELAGTKVLVVKEDGKKEEGTIVGPFGKAGKCKVSFEQGLPARIGSKAEIQL